LEYGKEIVERKGIGIGKELIGRNKEKGIVGRNFRKGILDWGS
jgi:hypothetical protein